MTPVLTLAIAFLIVSCFNLYTGNNNTLAASIGQLASADNYDGEEDDQTISDEDNERDAIFEKNEDNWQLYEYDGDYADEVSFSFHYPADWNLTYSESEIPIGHVIDLNIADNDDPEKINQDISTEILLFHVPPFDREDLVESVKEEVVGLAGSEPDFEEKDLEINNIPAYRYAFDDIQPREGIYVYYYKENLLFIMNYNTRDMDDYDTNKVDAIFNSVKFD